MKYSDITKEFMSTVFYDPTNNLRQTSLYLHRIPMIISTLNEDPLDTSATASNLERKYFELGILHRLYGDHNCSRVDFEYIIEHASDHSILYHTFIELAENFRCLNNYNEVEKIFRIIDSRFLQYNESLEYYYFTKGLYFYEVGDIQQAILEFERCQEIVSNDKNHPLYDHVEIAYSTATQTETVEISGQIYPKHKNGMTLLDSFYIPDEEYSQYVKLRNFYSIKITNYLEEHYRYIDIIGTLTEDGEALVASNSEGVYEFIIHLNPRNIEHIDTANRNNEFSYLMNSFKTK